MKRLILAGVIVVLTAGCSAHNDERGRGDAPIGDYNDDAAEVVNFPDKFLNVATKCNHGHRIYSHTRAAAPVVVPNDPSCAK